MRTRRSRTLYDATAIAAAAHRFLAGPAWLT